MFSCIEALNFRCLKYIKQDLSRFQVLVGPNASGKTTFFEVLSFISRLLSEGLDNAIQHTTENFKDLIWNKQGRCFELAVEAHLPEDIKEILKRKYHFIRYEISIEHNANLNRVVIESERVLLQKHTASQPVARGLFPELYTAPETLISSTRSTKNTKPVVTKSKNKNDNYYAETEKGWQPSYKLGVDKPAFAFLPADESAYPASFWFRDLLTEGVQNIMLNSEAMQAPNRPGLGLAFIRDGSNLAWVVQNLKDSDNERYVDWLEHVKTALPDLIDISTIERGEDKSRYLSITYSNGIQVPSWAASDGTLRLLALTILPYLTDSSNIYLIEEPENGIHPKAVETVFQSLSSVYNGQVFIATHSPVILSVAKASDVLCFAKTAEGATDIVRGDRHPVLEEWQGEENLGSLFAAGVLG